MNIVARYDFNERKEKVETNYAKELAEITQAIKAIKMSTGVSYFEQFAWDLTKRGISNIDTPVLILGIDA